jgi:hypothetical protein
MRRIFAIILYFAGLVMGGLSFELVYAAWSVPNFCPSFITYHLTSDPNREICRSTLPAWEGLALPGYAFLLALCSIKMFASQGQVRKSKICSVLSLLTIFFLTTFGYLLIPWLAVGALSVEQLSLAGNPGLEDFISMGVSSAFVTAPFTLIVLVLVAVASKLFSMMVSRITKPKHSHGQRIKCFDSLN